MPYGYIDTQYIDFPHNTDEAYLRGLENRAGVSFQELLQEIDSRLATFNASVPALVASLIAATTETETEGGDVVAFEVNERGEYTMARGQRAEDQLFVLPIRDYNVGLALTEDGLMKMSQRQILRNISGMLKGLRRNQRLQVLWRLFSDEEIPQAKNSTAMSPGFIGSGTGANVFEGGFPDGRAIPGSYTHYFAADSDGAFYPEDTLDEAIGNLENFYEGAFDAVVTENMLSDLEDSDKYVKAQSALVRIGSDEERAAVDPNTYVGVYGEKVRIRKPIKNTTDKAIAIYKTEGNLNDDNPLAWRYDEQIGRSAVIRYRDQYPLSGAELRHHFGVGVNRRTKAVLVSAGSGMAAYTAPSFT